MSRLPFEELPVGSCFAFDPNSKQATRRKVGERQTVTIPGGKRPMRIENVEALVTTRACPTGFGRTKRKAKRKAKRARKGYPRNRVRVKRSRSKHARRR